MKLIFALSLAIFALPIAALPEQTNILVNGLFTQADFKKILANNQFDSLRIQRVQLTEAIRDRCQEHSRSGSVLEVMLTLSDVTQSYLFATSQSARNLRLCNAP